jgi:AraC-like DNA-binding protein
MINPYPSAEKLRQLVREARYCCSALAHRLEVSEKTLSRWISRKFGLAAKAWVDRRRIIDALPAIMKRVPLKAILEEFGFEQVSHFSRVFKRVMGVPLHTFRRSPEKFLGRVVDLDVVRNG